MLWNASDLRGFGLDATDGAIGSVDDILFDDQSWTARWLVIDTGTWLSGRKVLLPPSAMIHTNPGRRAFSVTLTRQQIKDSPDIDTHAPVSRQRESEIYGFYGWEPYWIGYGHIPQSGVGLPLGPNVPAPEDAAAARRIDEMREHGDPHLRSADALTGYYIQASDGDIGHVEDFLVDSENWVIRYIVVDTRNWWPGKKVLVSPRAVQRIDWAAETLDLDLTRDHIRNGPVYDPAGTVDRNWEERFHGYYRYPPYWI